MLNRFLEVSAYSLHLSLIIIGCLESHRSIKNRNLNLGTWCVLQSGVPLGCLSEAELKQSFPWHQCQLILPVPSAVVSLCLYCCNFICIAVRETRSWNWPKFKITLCFILGFGVSYRVNTIKTSSGGNKEVEAVQGCTAAKGNAHEFIPSVMVLTRRTQLL